MSVVVGGGGSGLPVPSCLGTALEGLGRWEEDRSCGEDEGEGAHGDGLRLRLDAKLKGEEDVEGEEKGAQNEGPSRQEMLFKPAN